MPVVKQIAVPQIQTIEKIVEIPMVQAGWYSFNGGGKVIFIASTVIIFSADFGRFKLSPESPGRGESGGSSSSGINYSGHGARRARTGRDQARRESPPSGATGAA